MAEKTPQELILENALSPKRASGDEGSVEQHPIADQIKAAEYAKEQTAAESGAWRGLGIRYVKLIPPGAD